MTEGGDQGRQYGDRYDDQYRDDSFPPPPAPPWGDQAPPSAPPAYGQPSYGEPGSDQPGYGQSAPGQSAQPAYGRSDPGQPAYGQAAPDEQSYGPLQPYGQQQPYGSAPPYQPPPYGQSPWGTPPPGYGGGPAVDYASWGARAGALLLDLLFTFLMYLPGLVVVAIGAATSENENEVNGPVIALGGLIIFASFLWLLWNQGWRQGAQGWSWGKQVVGIKLVRATDAQPPGGWLGIGRLVLRTVLGNVTFGVYTLLTYLWPLWDDRNQSLDDKILGTLVVRAR